MDRKIQRTAAVRTMSLLLALAAMMCLSACSLLNLNKKEEAADSRNTYQIYYTNAEHSRLQSISYEPQEQTFEGLLSEMLDYFEQPDKLETDSYSVIPEGVKINGYTIGVDSLLIDFSGSYISMNNIEEILLRAGIVKTLVQLPGIYSISLTVDGQPLEEPASGQVIGPMRGESFVDSPDDSINSYQFVSLNLYFPSHSADRLVGETREAFYSSNLIMERVIVDHLIKGPQAPSLLPLTSPAVQVNSVRVANEAVSPQMCLYAFVDSICSLCDVDGVAFRINGSADVRFCDEISLDQIFMPDMSYVEQTEKPQAQNEAGADDSALTVPALETQMEE